MPRITIAVDSGGVIGAFETDAKARAAVEEFKIPGWRPVLISKYHSEELKDGARIQFAFPIGSIAYPIAVASEGAIEDIVKPFVEAGIVEEGDHAFYAASVGEIIPAVRKRLAAVSGPSNPEAAEALLRIIAENEKSLAAEACSLGSTLSGLCMPADCSPTAAGDCPRDERATSVSTIVAPGDDARATSSGESVSSISAIAASGDDARATSSGESVSSISAIAASGDDARATSSGSTSSSESVSSDEGASDRDGSTSEGSEKSDAASSEDSE